MVTVVEEFGSRGGRPAGRNRVAAPGIPAGITNYTYYDSQWQAIETRTNGTANTNVTSQTVWSAAYINAPVSQDTHNAGVIQPNSRLYFTQDANWDTTAVAGYNSTTGTWNVVQRYVYSPYGNITILNPDFTTAPTGTQPLANNLYQGMALDPVTGLYYERARWYSPSLGVWISQDPAAYINGANTYQYAMNNPTSYVDPTGFYTTADSLGSGVMGSRIDIDEILKIFTPAATWGAKVASFSMDIDLAYNPGGQLPTILTENHNVSSLGGWGGAIGGTTPVLTPGTYHGHQGEWVQWKPLLDRSPPDWVDFLWVGGGSVVGYLFGGPVGAVGVAVGAYGMEHATDPSYIARINGRWFVWQSCRNQAVRIIDVGPGGQAVGTVSTPLPSTAPLFERPGRY